jgi:hypothetical protein
MNFHGESTREGGEMLSVAALCAASGMNPFGIQESEC